jgi:hypothetical protein
LSSFRRVFGLVGVVAGLTLIAPVQLAFAQVGDKNCSDFTYQEDAQAVLDQDKSDPNGLDGNNNGVACESLPHRLTQSSAPTSSQNPSQGGSGTSVTIPETSTTTSTRVPVKTAPQVKVKPVGGVATGGGEPDQGGDGGFLIGAGVLLAAGASGGMVLYLRRRPS